MTPGWTLPRQIEVLKRLYAEQVAYVAKNPRAGLPAENAVDGFEFMSYLHHKFSLDIIIEREIRIVDMVTPYVRGRVLDWGCHHGHAACLLRMRLGDAVDLYGCDVFNEDAYRPFYQYSGLAYRRLTHAYRLEYDNAFFDVVLSNGVLEHVPHECESLQEIGRIIKPGGFFVITALPNRYSYTEAAARLRGMGHERLYSVSALTRTLSKHGFRVIRSRYFFAMPTMLLGFPKKVRDAYSRAHQLVRVCNAALEVLWPLNRLSSNLMVVAERL